MHSRVIAFVVVVGGIFTIGCSSRPVPPRPVGFRSHQAPEVLTGTTQKQKYQNKDSIIYQRNINDGSKSSAIHLRNDGNRKRAFVSEEASSASLPSPAPQKSPLVKPEARQKPQVDVDRRSGGEGQEKYRDLKEFGFIP